MHFRQQGIASFEFSPGFTHPGFAFKSPEDVAQAELIGNIQISLQAVPGAFGGQNRLSNMF